MEPQDSSALKAELQELRERVQALERKAGLVHFPAKPAAPPRPSLLKPASESWQAGTVLGVVASLCFVLAAAFLIKLAVESGWLTPARQLGLAVSFGLALVAGGLALKDRDEEYAAILPACGAAVLYLAAYGGHLYYGLYGPWAAAGAASAVSAGALLLLGRMRSELVMGVSVAGTYVGPLLIPVLRGGSTDSMLFFLVWDLAFLAWSLAAGRRELAMLACYMAVGAFAASSPTVRWNARPEDLARAAGFQFAQFALFTGAIGYFSARHRRPLSAREAWAFLPVLLFFYATEYSLLTRLSPHWAPWAALAFAGFVYGVYLLAGESLGQGELESAPVVNAFAAVALFHALYLELLPERAAPWLAVALLAGATALGPGRAPGRLWPFGAAAALVVAINYLSILFLPPKGVPVEAAALNLSFAAALLAACLSWRRGSGKPQEDFWLLALLAASAQALAGLHRLARLLDVGAYERFATTSLWAAFAIGLLGLAESRKDALLRRCAVVVLLLAAGKGLVFDVSATQPVVRIFCMLVLGAALYFSGFLLRRVDDVPAGPAPGAAPAP